MPTKPATTLKGWATDTNYSTGPKAGSPTKQTIPDGVAAEGHRPGKTAPTAAEYWNWWLNVLWLWIDWLRQGSSAGAANAHICETDSTGKLQLESLVAQPSTNGAVAGRFVGANDANALEVLHNSGLGAQAIYLLNTDVGSTTWTRNTGGGLALYALSDSGTGAYLKGYQGALCEATGDAPALRANGANTGSSPAVEGLGGAGGAGGRFVGGSTSGHGCRGEAGNNTQYGVYGVSTADGQATAAGVRGDGLTLAPGVWGTGVSSPGVVGTASGAPGVYAACSGTARGALYLASVASDPSSTISGDLAVNAHDAMYKLVMNSTWCAVMWRRRGSAGEIVAGNTSSTTNDFTNPVTVMTRALTNHQAPKFAGKVLISIAMGIGRTGTCSIGIDLVDVTASVTIKSWTLALYQSGAGVYERETNLQYVYSLPGTGNRTFRVDVYRVSGAGTDTVRWRDSVLRVNGVFE